MSIRKIKNAWYVDFRYNNKRYRNKSPIDTRNGAQAYETDMKSKLMRGEPLKSVEIPQGITFKDFSSIWIESYAKANNRPSEIKRKQSVFVNSLIPFFGAMPLQEITNKKIEEFKVMRLKSICSKTLRNEISMLSTCLKTAVEWEYLETPPLIKMPKATQTAFKWLQEDECLKLLQATDGMLHDMVFLAMKTGLRFGELIALTWPDFDFEHQKLTVNKSVVLGKSGPTKSGKVRYIPLTKSICEYFKSVKQKDGLVFCEESGEFVHQKRIGYHLGKAYIKAGLPNMGWHALRHTFASHLANKGGALFAIKDLLGHSDIKTTMRYSHLGLSLTTETMKLLS